MIFISHDHLAIGPSGLPLLHESGHALLAVIGGKGGVEQPLFKSQALLQWQFLIFFYVSLIRYLILALLLYIHSFFKTFGRQSNAIKIDEVFEPFN